MGRCSIRRRFLEGIPLPVGYLSDLRLDAGSAGRFDILRRGYQYFRELHEGHPPAFYFTSIAADNERSRRFLERGLPGMPAYRFLSEFVTVLLPTPRHRLMSAKIIGRTTRRLENRGLKMVSGSPENVHDIVDCLNRHGKRHALAPHWTAEELCELQKHSLPLSDLLLVKKGAQTVACGGLWDQRGFRQTVIHGYNLGLSLVRPGLNAVAGLFHMPALPRAGSVLAHAFLSPLAVDEGQDDDALLALIERSLVAASERGLSFLTLGFATNDPGLKLVRKQFRVREYRSRLYSVCWPPRTGAADSIAGAVFPEIGLL